MSYSCLNMDDLNDQIDLETVNLCLKNENTELETEDIPGFVFLNNFQPLPGTPVYDDLVRKGEIKDGLLPENYSDGVRAYTPVEFAEFNFPKFILRTYLQMVIKDPLNLPYMLSFFPPALLVEKVISNVIAMFRGGGYVPPPRTVDQPTSPASDIS